MRRRGACPALGLVAVLVLAGAAQGAAAPRRVVSLNPCLDVILLAVADPGQIAALSHYSREPGGSTVTALARRYPFTWGSAEEIVALRPDLVLVSGMGPPILAGPASTLHITEAHFPVPASVDESLDQVWRVAILTGHPERGAALVSQLRAALAAAAPRAGEPRLKALLYEHQGLATGPGTLMDELMRRAGFDNLAPRYGLRATGEVPLEAVIADPPQVLLAGGRASSAPGWADRILSQPALRGLANRMRREFFPEVFTYCAGPVMAPAAQALARARENVLAGVSR